MIGSFDYHFGYMMLMLKLRVTFHPTSLFRLDLALTRVIVDNEGLLTLDHPKFVEGIIKNNEVMLPPSL